ncbi:MAG TPA: PilZ domain-containing protein [Candidatus Sulfotelmatobacter sp.]|nr:PilZ domain-containing protein [Candidatus Sulfotelmatobacter sp.]
MSRFAAVFCHDAPSLRILKAALEEAGIDHRICRSQQHALELALGGQCSLLMADFILPGAGEVVKVASLLLPPQKPVVLAIAGEYPGTGEAFQSGATRILYRPLAGVQVRDALHEMLANGRKHPKRHANKRSVARLSLAKTDRRAAARAGIKALVYLELETGTLPAIGVDVSEQGLAVQAAEPIPARAKLRFRCVLPGTNHHLRGQADVIWTDHQGRAGMFFSHLPPASRKLLKHWLARGHAHSENAVRVLLPPAGVALFS